MDLGEMPGSGEMRRKFENMLVQPDTLSPWLKIKVKLKMNYQRPGM